MEKVTVGDFTCHQLEAELMLFKNSKVKEATFKFEDGQLRTKILLKKGRSTLRYREHLVIDEVESFSIKEFYNFIVERASELGEDRMETKRKRRQKEKAILKEILEG